MGWDLQDAIEVMEYVKAFEDWPESMYLEKAEAAEQLAAAVRLNIEENAELGGWYGELMQKIGEGDELDDSILPRGDLRVGRFRVHLIHEGERYGGISGELIYGKAVDSATGFSYNDCREFGHGLPLVDFYDMAQDPAKFPDGQFVSRYYMSTLLGMDSPLNSIENMQAFSLDGGVPSWTIKGDDVQKVYSYLLAARTALEYRASQDIITSRNFEECGTFTDHGFGFHAHEGTRTDYVIGWPLENDGWAVLIGSYDLEDDSLDCYYSEDDLTALLSNHGYPSLDDLKRDNGETWGNVLTGIIAKAQEDNRFEVPHYFSSYLDALGFCRKTVGMPIQIFPVMEHARAEYEKDKSTPEPEKVSLKNEVATARSASAVMADNGNHENRGQEAR